jgi:hypothetical protein
MNVSHMDASSHAEQPANGFIRDYLITNAASGAALGMISISRAAGVSFANPTFSFGYLEQKQISVFLASQRPRLRPTTRRIDNAEILHAAEVWIRAHDSVGHWDSVIALVDQSLADGRDVIAFCACPVYCMKDLH